MKNENEEKLTDFIPWQRDYYRAFLDGRISETEFNLLHWLHYLATSDGIVHAKSHAWIVNNVPTISIKPNTVGKLLKSLQDHKWIQYEGRQGSRSGFKIYIMNWKALNGKIRRFKELEITNKKSTFEQDLPEVNTRSSDENHKLPVLINRLETGSNSKSIGDVITRSYNYNENQNYKNNDRKSNKCTSVEDFIPNSQLDDKLKRIAETVGEKEMGFIFSVYERHEDFGVRMMEQVATDLIDKPGVTNKPAYFNSEVRRLLNR